MTDEWLLGFLESQPEGTVSSSKIIEAYEKECVGQTISRAAIAKRLKKLAPKRLAKQGCKKSGQRTVKLSREWLREYIWRDEIVSPLTGTALAKAAEIEIGVRISRQAANKILRKLKKVLAPQLPKTHDSKTKFKAQPK